MKKRSKITQGKRNLKSKILLVLVYLATFITFISLFWVVIDVILRGLPHIRLSLFEWKYTTDNQSMMPAILNTLEMVIITLLVAVPIGVLTAVYMIEYAKPENKLFKLVDLMVETLQGIPSIIFGLFGILFFGKLLGLNYTLIAGALTMSIMVLPLIITSTIEALKAVPNSQREASYALGARKLRTIFNVILPSASVGIFSGIILAIGRVVGETAALMYTSGITASLANPLQSGRTLALHMYMLSTESLYKNEAYATAFVLLLVVIVINTLSSYLNVKLDTNKER